jgi:hypothetical protein
LKQLRFRSVIAALFVFGSLVLSVAPWAEAAGLFFTLGNNSDNIGSANLDGTGVNESFITGLSSGFGGDLAVGGNFIYWTNLPSPVPGGGNVARANLDGTGVNQSFITGINPPGGGVAVEGNFIYWTTGSPPGAGIGRANLDGTGVDQSFITTTNFPIGVAVVPEPTPGLLLMLGISGLAMGRRRVSAGSSASPT